MSTLMVQATLTNFRLQHQAHGAPALYIYPPVDEWTLASGVSFDDLSDTFVDGSDDATTQDYSDQTYTEAGYVPVGGNEAVDVLTLGRVDTGRLSVVVAFTTSVDGALDDAWGIEVPGGSGNLYALADEGRTYLPQGVTTPALIRLDLTERAA